MSITKANYGKYSNDYYYIMNTLSDRIKLMLVKKDLKQVDLAKAAGVSTAAVNKWVKGNTKNLKNDNLVAIAEFLGVSIGWLANGYEEHRPLPFKKIKLDDLILLSQEHLEDIEDYILMKISKAKEKSQIPIKKTA